MTIKKLRQLIISCLSDDLLHPKYFSKLKRNKVAGHCYIASEVAYHLLGGKEKGWKSYHLKHENSSHWFLKHIDGRILDLTVEQFFSLPNYNMARGKGFLTNKLSKRGQKLLARIKINNEDLCVKY